MPRTFKINAHVLEIPDDAIVEIGSIVRIVSPSSHPAPREGQLALPPPQDKTSIRRKILELVEEVGQASTTMITRRVLRKNMTTMNVRYVHALLTELVEQKILVTQKRTRKMEQFRYRLTK